MDPTMDTIKFLKKSELKEIITDYETNKTRKKEVGYNLFTISSYNSYLENFHSDIIASLLDPKALHSQKKKFLVRFIEFLNNTFPKLSIDANNFKHALVTREEKRIDIWIRDEISKHCIIIENKINNANDQKEQIVRYFEKSEEKYNVVAIVYLSLDGLRTAPREKKEIEGLICNIGAFTDKSSDLVHGWLEPCLEDADNFDSKSFLYQYINLLKHLANKNMDKEIIKRFYQFLNENEALKTVDDIIEMRNSISEYRAEKFSDNLKDDYAPFKKKFRHKPHYWVFEDYREGKSNFKLDVEFQNDGSVLVVFWDTSNQGEVGKETVRRKLKSINAEEDFEAYKFRFRKEFKICDDKTMNQVDDEVIQFTKDFMEKLSKSNKD